MAFHLFFKVANFNVLYLHDWIVEKKEIKDEAFLSGLYSLKQKISENKNMST